MEVDIKSPFGKYQLQGKQKAAYNLTKRLRSKPLINLIRAVGGLRSCKVADVEVYGGRMRLYPGINRSDKVMLAKPHIFDWREREALAEHLKKAQHPSFIDIGANIGAYSVFVNGLFLSTKIIAIEADKIIFERLKFNLPENPNIKLLNMAVAAEEGVVSFYINEKSRGESGLIADSNKTKVEVPAKPLVKIMDEAGIQRPSALKIDVEGAEMEIFKNFYENVDKTRWPELVLVEYYHDSQAKDFLISKGYREVLSTKMNIVLKYEQN